MIDLLLPIEKLHGVGSRNVSRLYKLGLKTIKDLLWHIPTRYDDYTEIVPISKIEPGQKVNIQGEIVKINSKRIFPRRLFITNAIIQDESGAVKAVWFNQPFISNSLSEGTLVSLAGKVNLDKHGLYLASPTYEKISATYTPPQTLTHTGRLVPTYPETEGVSSKYLRFLIKPLLKNLKIDDPLPEVVVQKHSLPTLEFAIQSIHFPKDIEEANLAKDRLAFDDLLLFQIKALFERRKINQLKSFSIKFDKGLIADFISKLPFTLTTDQKISAWEIFKDLEKNYPMNRLMEGDVGSGKTVVALLAAFQTAKAGLQSVFLAPTEVLAQQHYITIIKLLGNPKSENLSRISRGIRNFKTKVHIEELRWESSPQQIRQAHCPEQAEGQYQNSKSKNEIGVALLTGSEAKLNEEKISKSELKKLIQNSNVQIVIGTHAIIQKDVNFKNLALVIIDEQHRFGINQRAALVKNSELVPHLLSMTATPIPRTLALTIYGDLDISIIKEKPKNRQKIITKIISPKERTGAYQFIRTEVGKGRQVFVVCPRIELTKKDLAGAPKTKSLKQQIMSEMWADVKAVEEEYKKLSQEIFPNLKVAMLHGKLKPKEKNEIMTKFKNKEYDILVSTSVIEVGVDVPNATIMMIESAERFGLAQLHQFRGRVGRDEYQSHCLLFTSTPDRLNNQRLKALVKNDNGFELAEQDMKLRGPGEFFGVKQSGLPDLAMASLANIDLIKKARAEARLLIKEDPLLKNYPLLRQKLESFQKLIHFE